MTDSTCVRHRSHGSMPQIIYFNDDNTNAVMQLGPVASTGGGPGPY
jgi:hypothetical protein